MTIKIQMYMIKIGIIEEYRQITIKRKGSENGRKRFNKAIRRIRKPTTRI